MILFPEWPSPREMARMTPAARAQWGLLTILQGAGLLLAVLITFS